MKRLYTIAMAIAAVITAQALTPMQGKTAPKSAKNFDSLRAAHTEMLAGSSLKSKAPMLKAKSREAEGPEDLLLSVEGRKQTMMLTTTHFLDTWFGMMYIREEMPGNIVWGEDGTTVYIRDIISGLPSGVYVKGDVADGKVTVQLPQYCYYEEFLDEETDEYYFASFYACKMELNEDEDDYVTVAQEDNYVVYTIGEDGSLTLDLNDDDPEDVDTLPMYIIGICADTTPGAEEAWLLFGESYQEYTPFNETAVEAPADVEFEPWAMMAGENGIVQVGILGDDVYIKGFDPEIENMTIKGTIDGDKVVFDCPQFLGEAYDHFVYLMACEWENEDWEEFEFLDQLVMSYDAEGKVMSVDNPLIDVLLNLGTLDYDPLVYFEHPTFLYQTEEDVNADPEDPYVEYFSEYEYRPYMDASEGYIEWIIPATNVKGFLLNTENMYYNFLINGEIVTFTVEEYPFFDEDMSDIPYDYTEGMDLQAFGDSRYITYKQADAKTFGLQSFYLGSDGVLYKSNLVTYEPELSGISSVQMKSVKSVEFYNMQGQKVTDPTSGIYIMRNVYEDGTSSVCKVSRK